MDILELLTQELAWDKTGVKEAIKLFDDGKTLPFIARYRKDQTRGLDDEKLFILHTRLKQLRALDEEMQKSLEKLQELGVLSDHMKNAIEACQTLSDLNEIMKPYKSKRKTKAMKARELGLQPIANIIMGRKKRDIDKLLVNGGGDRLEQIETALDIVAEEMIAHPSCKEIAMANISKTEFEIDFNSDNENVSHYENLLNINKVPDLLKPHQIHSLLRAQREGVLKIKLQSDYKQIADKIYKDYESKPSDELQQFLQKGVEEGVRRLLIPRSETALIANLREKADKKAITTFKANLKNLLHESPIPSQVILGIDPGYRTGCKVAVIDEKGDLLDTITIYPTPPKSDYTSSKEKILPLLKKHGVTFISVGDGTGSRETTQFVEKLLSEEKLSDITYQVVPETGASVYSASKTAREEFPELQVEIRGAVSIARRVLDPVAEYVKIDPKSLGVGQYQHDVNQTELDESLAFVLSSSVNQIGVKLDTASKELLSYVSGITPSIARNIIKYRSKTPFKAIQELMNVPRLGEATFEQASGFLRLFNSEMVLDRTMIHPDDYSVAIHILVDCGHDPESWLKISEAERAQYLRRLKHQKYISEEHGKEKIADILNQLTSYGKDPRGERKIVNLTNSVETIEDLEKNSEYTGKVKNVAAFGAFIDLGIKTNGLIHISQLADRFVQDIHSIVKLGDIVKVKVLDIDIKRKRISLKLLEVNGQKP